MKRETSNPPTKPNSVASSRKKKFGQGIDPPEKNNPFRKLPFVWQMTIRVFVSMLVKFVAFFSCIPFTNFTVSQAVETSLSPLPFLRKSAEIMIPFSSKTAEDSASWPTLHAQTLCNSNVPGFLPAPNADILAQTTTSPPIHHTARGRSWKRGEVGVGGGGREPKRWRGGRYRGQVLSEDMWEVYGWIYEGMSMLPIVIHSFIIIIIILTPTFGPFSVCTIAFKLCQNVEFDDLLFKSWNADTRTL